MTIEPLGEEQIDVAARVAHLSPHKRALLEARLRGESPATSIHSTIPRRSGSEPMPMSFAQERLWFLEQLEPGTATYNVPLMMRLVGHLDVRAFQAALSELVRRHDTLRTTFADHDGRADQIVAPPHPFPAEVIDLSALPHRERNTDVWRRAKMQARQPFDLTRGPLFRVTVMRVQDDEHFVAVTMHHIISDAWSVGIFIGELLGFYRGFVAGQPPRLSPLPIQYGDFAMWQRHRLGGDLLNRQLAYWRRHLAGSPLALELPTDKPRPAIRTSAGARVALTLPPDLSGAVKAVTQRYGATLYMGLLAAFYALLHRYTGQTDISIGSPIAGRTPRETEPLIGFFVNTLVMRTNLQGDPSFGELLQRVREVALAAYAHQEMPFEMLVEALRPTRTLSHSPLFQVMFGLQNAPRPIIETPELELEFVDVETGTAKFDLTVSLLERERQVTGYIEYSTDLFEAATISRMAKHFHVLLQSAVANPEQPISTLPLLSPEERQQLLVEWNSTAKDYSSEGLIHELIEVQASRTPHAIAVVYENKSLTYEELNRRANQLARYLRRHGVGLDDLVGICMERSLEMVVGLLGILKAGAAYLPLEPTYPTQRLAFMLEDADPPLLLTQQHLVGTLPGRAAEVVCLDSDWSQIADDNAENLATGVRPDNLVYVMYTSGSTGKPKGVMICHDGLRNRLLWAQDAYRLTTEDCILQKTPFGFDVSVWEFFLPLMVGARLVMARPDGHRDPSYLTSVISEQRVTTLHFVPSMLSTFLDEPGLERCTSLKRVLCSGEALPFELQERFFSKLSAELHNLYGPTEASIDVTSWACERHSGRNLVPIGRPIANTRLYILDQHLKPVPIAIAGQLHVGGVGLARGYLNRPELTVEKFVPDPFSGEPNDRLYATGDRARYLPDGSIDFLGRIDDQVKLRGFRIELGEVEAVLRQHPDVREAAVAVREDTAADRRLVAYLVMNGGQSTAETSELRSHLKSSLPDYMVPSLFVQLDSLPLSPNGKLDRGALPPPRARAAAIGSDAHVAPQTTLEKSLAAIWTEVLHVDQIGIHDNFFDFGGHSLLAAQLVARIRSVCQVELPLRQFFEGPTIESMARYLADAEQGVPSLRFHGPSCLVNIGSGGVKTPFVCVHPVGGTVFCYVVLARHLGDDRPFYGLQSLGVDGEREPLLTIEQMAACYLEELRRHVPKGPYFLGGWSLGGVIAFEMAQQLLAHREEVAFLALLDPPSLDLTDAPQALDDSSLVIPFARYLMAREDLDSHSDSLNELPFDAQLAYLLDQARRAGALPPGGELFDLHSLFRVFRANVLAEWNYFPRSITIPVTLLQAEHIPHPRRQRAQTRWREVCVGGLDIDRVPGDHFTMLREPDVKLLADRLRARMDDVERAVGTNRRDNVFLPGSLREERQ